MQGVDEALRLARRPMPHVYTGIAHLPLDDEFGRFLDEDATSAGFAPLARDQFRCGRLAARAAMAAAGALQCSVPSDVDGVPTFPVGFVGSISHKSGHACAAVGLSTSFRGVGIDLEVDEASDEQALIDRVCTEEERPLLRTLVEHRLRSAATWLLSAKEAVYKAVFPIERVAFDFGDIELEIGATEGSFRVARLCGERRADIHGSYGLVGRWLVCLVISTP